MNGCAEDTDHCINTVQEPSSFEGGFFSMDKASSRLGVIFFHGLAQNNRKSNAGDVILWTQINTA